MKYCYKKILSLVVILLLSLSMVSCSGKKEEGSKDDNPNTEAGESVKLQLEIESDKNALFSKYDIDIFLDGDKIGTVSNGDKYSGQLDVSKGSHELKLCKDDDESISGVETITLEKDTSISFFAKHDRKSIEINSVETADDTAEQKTETTESATEIEEKTEITEDVTEASTEQTTTEKTTENNAEDLAPLYYTTNSSVSAPNGNSGKYAYKKSGKTYDQYYVIDFDEGYVYYFTNGNGNENCERTKITEGNLNDRIIITYHDGEDEWSYGLHFNYKNRPDKLIVEDSDHFTDEYMPTSLEKALSIIDSRGITDY